jgi:hypothetical protein
MTIRRIDMDQRIKEKSALSLGMEGLCALHSEHKDAGPIRECACEYAKAFRVISDMRREEPEEQVIPRVYDPYYESIDSEVLESVLEKGKDRDDHCSTERDEK